MLGSENYINAHTHREGDERTLAVVNIYPQDAGKMKPGKYYSMGLHPWYIPEKGVGRVLDQLEQQARREEVVAIGECGLDKLSTVSMDLQQYVFERQVVIAERTGKPLIIHCVRAFNELVELKSRRETGVEWIIHGFNSNLHVADMLLRHELYFSFGKALLHPASNASQVLPQLEDEVYLLETDDADIPIARVYDRAAELTGMDPETLRLSMMTNFINIFKV